MPNIEQCIYNENSETESFNTKQNFIENFKLLLCFYRLITITPIRIRKNLTTGYYLETSKQARIFCLTVIVGIVIIILVDFKNRYEQRDVFGIFYICTRDLIFISVNVLCFRKHEKILLGIQGATAMGVPFPARYAWSIIVTSWIGLLPIIVISYRGIPSSHKKASLIMHMIVTSTMCFVFVGLCSILNWQVATLGKALAKVNTQITELLKDPISLNAETSRHLMQRHRKVHDLCSLLNEVYGLPLLLILAAVFLEAVFCIAYYYQNPDYVDGLTSFVYAFWQAIPTTMVMYTCQRSENEFTKTIGLMSRIKDMCVQTATGKGVEPLVNSLFEWEVQLRHQRLAFNTAGFFPLNASQLQTELSTIACYTVILMQIQR